MATKFFRFMTGPGEASCGAAFAWRDLLAPATKAAHAEQSRMKNLRSEVIGPNYMPCRMVSLSAETSSSGGHRIPNRAGARLGVLKAGPLSAFVSLLKYQKFGRRCARQRGSRAP